MRRKGTIVLSTRVTPAERAQVAAVAVAAGLSVSELVGRIVVSEVQDRLRQDLAVPTGSHA